MTLISKRSYSFFKELPLVEKIDNNIVYTMNVGTSWSVDEILIKYPSIPVIESLYDAIEITLGGDQPQYYYLIHAKEFMAIYVKGALAITVSPRLFIDSLQFFKISYTIQNIEVYFSGQKYISEN